MKQGYTYILTNKAHSTLYVGVTSDLSKRLYEHQNKIADGFSKRYNLGILVYMEQSDDICTAIEREKYIKGKTRKFKENLVYSQNPHWEDLGIKFGIVSSVDCSENITDSFLRSFGTSPQDDGRNTKNTNCHSEQSEESQRKKLDA